MAARFFSALILTIFVFLSALFNPVLAQQNIGSESAQIASTSAAINNPQSPQYANAVAINLIHTISCLAEGTSIIGQPCLDISPGNNKPISILYQPSSQSNGGTMGIIGDFMTALYTTPPLSTAEYIGYVKENLGFVKEAHAQVTGAGESVLHPIFQLWQLSRNITYLGLTFIFLVIGLMIMFRTKINAQTVISAQAALPSLIIGLVMITFSYFLASLIVDTTFVTTQLAGNVLEQYGILDNGKTKELLQNENIFGIYGDFMGDQGHPLEVAGTVSNTLKFLHSGIVGNIIDALSALAGCRLGVATSQLGPLGAARAAIPDIHIEPFGIGADINGERIADAIACTSGAALGWVVITKTSLVGGTVGLILYLVLIVALLVAMFKVLFELIQAYIKLLVYTIAGPFFFLAASIPGRTSISTGWIRSMLANILIFPAVFAGLLFAAYIIGIGSYTKATFAGTAGGSALPLLGGLSSDFLRLILGYGVLLMLPAVPGTIKSAMKEPGFGAFGSAIIGGVTSAYGRSRGMGQNFYNTALGNRTAVADERSKAASRASYLAGTGVTPNWANISENSPRGELARLRVQLNQVPAGVAPGGTPGGVPPQQFTGRFPWWSRYTKKIGK